MSPEPQPDRPRRPRVRKLLRRFRRSELGGLARDTGFVAIWQASIVVAALGQIALITHSLGIGEYGRYAAVVAFVELIGGFFNLRVGYAMTTFGARWLVRDARGAAGVFQYGAAIDLGAMCAAVPILAVLAFTAGPGVVGDGAGELILLYTLALICPALSRAAYVILRLLDRFALLATYQWALELGRLAMVLGAVVLFDSLLAVIVAVAVARLIAGVVDIVVAARVFRRTHDVSLLRSHMRWVDRAERRAMMKMMFHTFIISYSSVVRAQLPTVLLGVFAGPLQTGIYKIGTAAATSIGKVIQPASNALLPRLSRLWAAGHMLELRKLVFRASAISVVAMAGAFGAVVAFQDPILRALGGGEEGLAAGTVLILGSGSQALYGLVFWHSTLLYAADRTGPMSVVSLAAAVVHVLGMLVLVPGFGATGAAVALLISQVIVNVSLTTLALRALKADIDGAADDPAAIAAGG